MCAPNYNAVLRRKLISPVLSNDCPCFSKILAENESKNNELHNKKINIVIITKVSIQRNGFAPQLPT